MKRTIAQNTTYMTMASVLQKVIAFVYFTVIANMIGAEGTGKYFFALSFTTVFVVFIDLGFTNVFIREAARAKDKLQMYLSTLLAFKLGMSVLVYIAAVVAIHLLGYPIETRHLVYMSGITMIFDTFHLTMYGSLRAVGDLRYEAGSIIASQFVTLVLGSVFLFLKLPLIYLIMAFTIPSGLNVLFVGTILAKQYRIYPKLHFDKDVFKFLGKIAVPFALAAIFARVYSYLDSILLSKIMGDVAVGLYSIPYKITFAFQFIPLALVAALYPRFSEFFQYDKKRLAYIFERSLKYLMLIAFPIAVGIGILAKDILMLIYDIEYLASVIPLQILIASLIFSYLSFPIGAFLNACNKQVSQTVIVGIVMLANLGLNLFLIPIYGIAGAAISALIGNILLTLLGYIIIPQVTKVSHRFVLGTFVRLLLLSSIMGYIVWLSNTHIHFLLSIIVGALSYILLLFMTKTVTKQQLVEMKQLIRRNK